MGKKKHIPKLRFREFYGEWEIKLLSQIAEKSSKKNKDKKVTDVFTNSAIHGIVNQRDYFDKDIANQKNLLDYYIVDSNDFVYNPRISENAPVGPMRRNHNDTGVMSPLYTVIRFKACDLDFIEHYFLTNHWHSYMELIANYGARADRMSIRTEQLFKMPISLPTLPEQKKIADFLSAIDERIEYLTKKKELLERYKKGVMQKIFSQKLRFKDESGKPFPKWENISARSLFASISNKSHESDLPILAATQENGMQYRDQIGVKIISSDKSISTYKIVEKGDFVISLRSFQGGIEYSQVTGICSPAYTVLKPLKIIHDHFYRYYFKKDTFITQLNGLIVGIRDGKQISYEAFSTLTLPYPSLPEQKKIADFLTAIDDKIEHVTRQLEKTTEYKKGLLQQMFV